MATDTTPARPPNLTPEQDKWLDVLETFMKGVDAIHDVVLADADERTQARIKDGMNVLAMFAGLSVGALLRGES